MPQLISGHIMEISGKHYLVSGGFVKTNYIILKTVSVKPYLNFFPFDKEIRFLNYHLFFDANLFFNFLRLFLKLVLKTNAMKRRVIYFILLACLLITTKGKSQLYWETIDNYSTRNGLPNNSVLSVFQDSKGFMWVGTINGLCRYDGREFKLYKIGTTNTDESWVNSVTVIKEDHKGNIWIGTRAGILAHLDVKWQTWEWFTVDDEYITALFFDELNTGWVGTKKGKLLKLENDTGWVTKALCNNTIYNIQQAANNKLFIASEKPYLFDKRENNLQELYLKNAPSIDSHQRFYSDGKNAFYFLTTKQIFGINIKEGNKHKIDFEFNVIENVPGILSNGNLLLLNKESLAEISPQGNIVYAINLDENSQTLKGNTVNTIFEDNTGLIWIGTNAGLFKLDKNKTQFEKYTSNTLKQRIKHNYVRSLYSIKNELWVGTKEGQIGKIVFDTITRKQIAEYWYNVSLPNGQLNKAYTINAIITDKEGTVWAAGDAVYRMRRNESTFSLFYFIGGAPSIFGLFDDGSGHLLVGNTNNLLIIDKKTKETKICEYNGKEINFPVWNIVKTNDGQLWAGTRIGAYQLKWDRDKETYSLYTDFHANISNVIGGNIWSIVEDNLGNIWFGSTDDGITKVGKGTEKFSHYTVNDGLTSNTISGIVCDKKGNIWVSTISGLSKYTPENNKFITFNEEDGIISNDFNFKACTATQWGELFFGTKVGMAAFYPNEIKYEVSREAPVKITGFKIKGIDNPEYLLNKEVKLSYDQNDLSFRFTILEYRKEFSHSYKFILKGFEDKWQEVSFNNPAAVYTNVPPGRYTFIVMASPDGKEWSSSIAEMVIIISPALWQRTYFWIIVGLCIAFIIYIVIRQRIRAILSKEREKARLRKTMAELEMKALRAQMNPHFIFNAIGAVQHYIVKNNTLQANEYLSKFARLMRLFLESSRNNYILLQDEIDLLDLYSSLEKLRFEEKFDYRIELNGLATDKILIPSMLLQPFVENAINHGLIHLESKGFLLIHFEYTDNTNSLLCIIDDNGIGRSKADLMRRQNTLAHIPRGGEIVQERIKAFVERDININIEVTDKFDKNNEPAGTLVKVVIPLAHT